MPPPPSQPVVVWVYTCDLVVAYIHIHMLLMPGINNVALTWHTGWRRQKDTPKIQLRLSAPAPTTTIEVSENLLFLFFFWLKSGNEVHLHNLPECGSVLAQSVSDRVAAAAVVVVRHQNIKWKMPPKEAQNRLSQATKQCASATYRAPNTASSFAANHIACRLHLFCRK